MNARSAPHSLTELSATVSNTACKSNVVRLMTLSTSPVAVCCSRASFSSRVSRAIIASWPAETLKTTPFLRRVSALHRLAGSHFDWLPACFGVSAHCLPQGSGRDIVAGQVGALKVAGRKPPNVRFGSEADIPARSIDVRFTPKSGH